MMTTTPLDVRDLTSRIHSEPNYEQLVIQFHVTEDGQPKELKQSSLRYLHDPAKPEESYHFSFVNTLVHKGSDQALDPIRATFNREDRDPIEVVCEMFGIDELDCARFGANLRPVIDMVATFIHKNQPSRSKTHVVMDEAKVDVYKIINFEGCSLNPNWHTDLCQGGEQRTCVFLFKTEMCHGGAPEAEKQTAVVISYNKDRNNFRGFAEDTHDDNAGIIPAAEARERVDELISPSFLTAQWDIIEDSDKDKLRLEALKFINEFAPARIHTHHIQDESLKESQHGGNVYIFGELEVETAEETLVKGFSVWLYLASLYANSDKRKGFVSLHWRDAESPRFIVRFSTKTGPVNKQFENWHDARDEFARVSQVKFANKREEAAARKRAEIEYDHLCDKYKLKVTRTNTPRVMDEAGRRSEMKSGDNKGRPHEFMVAGYQMTYLCYPGKIWFTVQLRQSVKFERDNRNFNVWVAIEVDITHPDNENILRCAVYMTGSPVPESKNINQEDLIQMFIKILGDNLDAEVPPLHPRRRHEILTAAFEWVNKLYDAAGLRVRRNLSKSVQDESVDKFNINDQVVMNNTIMGVENDDGVPVDLMKGDRGVVTRKPSGIVQSLWGISFTGKGFVTVDQVDLDKVVIRKNTRQVQDESTELFKKGDIAVALPEEMIHTWITKSIIVGDGFTPGKGYEIIDVTTYPKLGNRDSDPLQYSQTLTLKNDHGIVQYMGAHVFIHPPTRATTAHVADESVQFNSGYEFEGKLHKKGDRVAVQLLVGPEEMWTPATVIQPFFNEYEYWEVKTDDDAPYVSGEIWTIRNQDSIKPLNRSSNRTVGDESVSTIEDMKRPLKDRISYFMGEATPKFEIGQSVQINPYVDDRGDPVWLNVWINSGPDARGYYKVTQNEDATGEHWNIPEDSIKPNPRRPLTTRVQDESLEERTEYKTGDKVFVKYNFKQVADVNKELIDVTAGDIGHVKKIVEIRQPHLHRVYVISLPQGDVYFSGPNIGLVKDRKDVRQMADESVLSKSKEFLSEEQTQTTAPQPATTASEPAEKTPEPTNSFGKGLELFRDLGGYKLRFQSVLNGQGPSILVNIDLLTNLPDLDSIWTTVVINPEKKTFTDEKQVSSTAYRSESYLELLRMISFLNNPQEKEALERVAKDPVWKAAEIFWKETLTACGMA